MQIMTTGLHSAKIGPRLISASEIGFILIKLGQIDHGTISGCRIFLQAQFLMSEKLAFPIPTDPMQTISTVCSFLKKEAQPNNKEYITVDTTVVYIGLKPCAQL